MRRLLELVDVRDVQLYGGLALYGVLSGRWEIVGLLLAFHAGVWPAIAARLRREG